MSSATHHTSGKKSSLTTWIFIGMAAGLLLGIFAPKVAVELAPLSNIFLRLIKSIIAPLIFGALVAGVAGAGDIKQMEIGRASCRERVLMPV